MGCHGVDPCWRGFTDPAPSEGQPLFLYWSLNMDLDHELLLTKKTFYISTTEAYYFLSPGDYSSDYGFEPLLSPNGACANPYTKVLTFMYTTGSSHLAKENLKGVKYTKN